VIDWISRFNCLLSGEVVEGMDVVTRIESYGSQSGQPKARIMIAASGTI
jgi:hypothetical protein